MDPTYHCNLQLQGISGTQWRDLCKELGIKQAGRRDELRSRVISYLRSDEGKQRINEVMGSSSLLTLLKILKLPLPGSQSGTRLEAKGCICGTEVQTQRITCSKCGVAQHRSCMGKAVIMAEFECPMCQLRFMEPFEQVVEVLLSPKLTSSLGSGVQHQQFQYTSEQHRRMQEPGRRRLIQFRCIRLDEEGCTYHWPPECTVLLNGKSLFTFTAPSASSSRKRKDTALTITALSVGSNQAMVMRQLDEDQYVFAIFLVDVVSPDTVCKSMAKHSLSAEEGKAFISRRTRGGDEVEARVCKASLRCPLSRLLPDTPVRGLNCMHIQCFDLRAFVLLQEKAKSNRWHCPICGLMVLTVTADKYMEEVVRKAKEEVADTVEFRADGSYVLIPDLEDEEVLESRADKRRAGLLPEPVLQKRQEVGGRLLWKDFKVTHVPEYLHTSRCYEAARTFTLVRSQRLNGSC